MATIVKLPPGAMPTDEVIITGPLHDTAEGRALAARVHELRDYGLTPAEVEDDLSGRVENGVGGYGHWVDVSVGPDGNWYVSAGR